jgi:hypothetical protein
VLLLLLLILELAEVHDPADRRLLVGSHLHQIQTGFPREAECLLRGDDAELPAFGGDDPNRRDPNLLVYAVLLLYGSRLRTRTRSAGREEVELFAHATSGTPPGNCRQTARASGPRRIPGKAEYSSGQGVASRRWPFLRPPCRLSGMIPACARQEECTGPLSEGCADHPGDIGVNFHGSRGRGTDCSGFPSKSLKKPINTKCPPSQITYFTRTCTG